MTRDLSLAAWQVRYEQRAFWRMPRAAVFTFLLPLMLLVVIGAIGGRAETVPGLLTYGIAMATFSNLAISFAMQRDAGIIKRVQATPLPWWAYVAGRVGSTTINAVLMTAISLTLATTAYGVEIPLANLPGLLATLILGVAAFTALGIGVVRWIPNGDSAPALVTFLVLPLSMISGVFAPMDGEPDWLAAIARAFPLHPLADGMRAAFDPATAAPGIVGSDLLVIAAWGAVGALAMAGFLRGLAAKA
jgi:ABC-2 type transport system permease protein